MRKLPPLTAGLYKIKYRIRQFSLGPFALTHPCIQGLDFRPLLIGQIAGVGLSSFSYLLDPLILHYLSFYEYWFLMPAILQHL